ncbi:hypothetical protein K8I61_16895 [bacterium]|nr:hypothetical protein [bacterium]
MPLSDAEFEVILSDASKVIRGDIVWQEDEDHSASVEFRAEVVSDMGWPLFVRGSFNRAICALTFTLILKTDGRIYGLDLGKDHHNPECTQTGELHKHVWRTSTRDKWAYAPIDITKPASDPVGVWKEFCAEASLAHSGKLAVPPPLQGDLLT